MTTYHTLRKKHGYIYVSFCIITILLPSLHIIIIQNTFFLFSDVLWLKRSVILTEMTRGCSCAVLLFVVLCRRCVHHWPCCRPASSAACHSSHHHSRAWLSIMWKSLHRPTRNKEKNQVVDALMKSVCSTEPARSVLWRCKVDPQSEKISYHNCCWQTDAYKLLFIVTCWTLFWIDAQQ